VANYLSTEEYLASYGIDAESVDCTADPVESQALNNAEIPEAVNINSPITTSGYLSDNKVSTYDFATAEGRKSAYSHHHISSRSKVLAALIIPMYVAPIWLMVMLTLPIFKGKIFSERMQFALLTALTSDLIGLCYVVTRDLFPKKPEFWNDDDE
jgi:hypothetical protein